MKFFALCLALLFAWSWSAAAANYESATITVTNAAGTTNGQTLTVNSDTRTWTNAVYIPTSQILTNNTAAGAAGNMIAQIANTGFSGLVVAGFDTTSITLRGSCGTHVIVSLSDGWGAVSYLTNACNTNATLIRVPYQAETNAAVRTNTTSGITAMVNAIENTNQVAYAVNAGTAALAHSFDGNGTNLVMHGGAVSTNDATHNWVILTNGGIFQTNFQTGSWLEETNDAILSSNFQTGASFVLTNGSGTFSGTLTATGAVSGASFTGDGSALTNLTFFETTNATGSGTFSAGKPYETNITGNITLNAFSGVPVDKLWSIFIRATNSDSSTHSITFPGGVVGSGDGIPPVVYVTNALTRLFQVIGWGNKATNVSSFPIY